MGEKKNNDSIFSFTDLMNLFRQLVNGNMRGETKVLHDGCGKFRVQEIKKTQLRKSDIGK